MGGAEAGHPVDAHQVPHSMVAWHIFKKSPLVAARPN